VATSISGLLADQELDDALGLGAMARERRADARTGKNGRHARVGMWRRSPPYTEIQRARLMQERLAKPTPSWPGSSRP
jgi:hypothetical protein